jgi:hypothetical protein
VTFHLPVLPPTLSAPTAGWTPRESFSPSQLAQYAGEGGCNRKWALRSLFGVGEAKQSKGLALGSLIHACLELYLKGGTVYDLVAPGEGPILMRLRVDEKTRKELSTYSPKALETLAAEAPIRALAGLRLVPDTKDPALECVEVEQWLKLDTSKIIGGIEPITINGKIDLSFRRAGVWYLHDHKSTKGKREGSLFDPWYFCKTPEDLANDPQSVFYGLDRMFRHGLDSLWSRWAYFQTDPKSHPQAKAVDVELHRSDLLPAAYRWLVIANEMREAVRAAVAGTVTPDDFAPSPDSCPAFGGCAYHHSKGGMCHPLGSEVKLSDFNLTGLAPAKQGVPNMSLAEKYAQTTAAIHGGPVVPHNPLLPPEAHQAAPVAVASAAPALPPLPPGWEYGPNNAPRPVAPEGQRYNAAGQLELIPPPLPPAPEQVAIVQTTIAPATGPGSGESAADGEKRGGRGRPKGATNKPKPTALTDLAEEMRQLGVTSVTFHADGTIASASLELNFQPSASA